MPPSSFDALFTNGDFHTMDPHRPRARAVGVHRSRIISLDDDIAPDQFAAVHDLHGATVIPGFHDAHHHLTFVGQERNQVDIRPAAAPTLAAVLDAIREAAARAEPRAWIIAAGYDQNQLGDHPTAEQLDAVSLDHPVYLVHKSRHMGVANTAAFAIAGYPERLDVPVPAGGSVPKDDRGRALGVLLETARGIITPHLPTTTVDDVADHVASGSAAALALGITSITDPGIGAPDHLGSSAWDIDGYQRAREQGRLGVRATVMPYLTTLHRLDGRQTSGHPHYGLDLGIRTGLGDEWLRIGPVKVLADGSLIGRSAYMTEDYEADLHDGCHNRGFLQYPQDELAERLTGAHLSGWQLAIHAIGDAALDVVLGIVATAQRLDSRSDARHRIEHLSTASDGQIRRLAELGMVAVPQGRFVHELGDAAVRAVGRERAPLIYRVRSLLDAGLVVPASTDAPVVSADPIRNVHALVSRQTASGAELNPEEAINVHQAIHAYTVGSAHAVHAEGEKGSLTAGKLADFAVLSDDIFAVPPEEIPTVTVDQTIVGGEVAHSR